MHTRYSSMGTPPSRQSATALSLLLDSLWPAELRCPDATAHL